MFSLLLSEADHIKNYRSIPPPPIPNNGKHQEKSQKTLGIGKRKRRSVKVQRIGGRKDKARVLKA
jgi:hypothetical protein